MFVTRRQLRLSQCLAAPTKNIFQEYPAHRLIEGPYAGNSELFYSNCMVPPSSKTDRKFPDCPTIKLFFWGGGGGFHTVAVGQLGDVRTMPYYKAESRILLKKIASGKHRCTL